MESESWLVRRLTELNKLIDDELDKPSPNQLKVERWQKELDDKEQKLRAEQLHMRRERELRAEQSSTFSRLERETNERAIALLRERLAQIDSLLYGLATPAPIEVSGRAELAKSPPMKVKKLPPAPVPAKPAVPAKKPESLPRKSDSVYAVPKKPEASAPKPVAVDASTSQKKPEASAPRPVEASTSQKKPAVEASAPKPVAVEASSPTTLDPQSPNQRRKAKLGNTLPTESVAKSLVPDLLLLPSDPECRFDLDALNADNIGNFKSIRIGFFGDCGVGKTSLAHVLAGEPFRDFPPTIFETTKSKIAAAGKTFELEFWDVSGSERYSKKRPVIYPNVNAFVVCFDLNDFFSFTNVTKIWLPEVAGNCSGLTVVLCGLKSDVGQAKVSRNDIDLAMRNAALSSARHFFYVETSAKNNKQLDDLLVKCVYCVLIDPAKMEQKTGPAMVAAQKLAQLEEIRRQSKAAPPSVPKPKTADRPSATSPTVLKRESSNGVHNFDFDSLVVSAPTGFRHLKSAAEILKEFDPDFALRAQKRPNALPIAEAQASLRKPSSLSSPPTSPKSPPVVSPRDEAWRQQAPKFAPINNTVFCRVTVPFEGEKEGDLSCGVVGEVLACNSSQDFAEDYWFGAKTDGQIGYFPQRNCCWIKDDQTQ